MAKPLLVKIPVFDATIGTTIYFSCYGEIDQIFYTIYDNINNEEVISNKVQLESSMVRSIKILHGEITNRADPYYIKIKARTKSTQKYGELSDPMLFYCHEEPELYFEDLSSDEENVIGTSSYRFNLIFNYIEDQNEYLNSYQYHLYDESKKLLSESKIFYNEIDNMYLVDGMDADAIYYIRGTGDTVNGYHLDTGFVKLVISYSVEKNTMLLKMSNNYKDGTIVIQSNIVSIDGNATGNIKFLTVLTDHIAAFIPNNGMLNYEIPIDNPSYNFYDFCLRIVMKYKVGKDIIKISTINSDGEINESKISLQQRRFTDYSDNSIMSYAILTDSKNINVYESNYLDYSTSNGYIRIDIKRESGLYSVHIENYEG